MTHPKWCALSRHVTSNRHYSVSIRAGFLEVALMQYKDEAPTLVIISSEPDRPAVVYLTLDEAQVLSAGLISLLMRTDAA